MVNHLDSSYLISNITSKLVIQTFKKTQKKRKRVIFRLLDFITPMGNFFNPTRMFPSRSRLSQNRKVSDDRWHRWIKRKARVIRTCERSRNSQCNALHRSMSGMTGSRWDMTHLWSRKRRNKKSGFFEQHFDLGFWSFRRCCCYLSNDPSDLIVAARLFLLFSSPWVKSHVCLWRIQGIKRKRTCLPVFRSVHNPDRPE